MRFVTAIILPLRDSTSFMLDNDFSNSSSFGMSTTTGILSSMSAIGPCFISLAEYPSAWMYEISFSLSAPSNATG